MTKARWLRAFGVLCVLSAIVIDSKAVAAVAVAAWGVAAFYAASDAEVKP